VPGSLSQEDIDYIREGYRLFKDGDPAFLDRFTPDAALVFPETLPKGGIYGSPWDALEYFNTMGDLFEDPLAEPEELLSWAGEAIRASPLKVPDEFRLVRHEIGPPPRGR
jgi:hypothetical protein